MMVMSRIVRYRNTSWEVGWMLVWHCTYTTRTDRWVLSYSRLNFRQTHKQLWLRLMCKYVGGPGNGRENEIFAHERSRKQAIEDE